MGGGGGGEVGGLDLTPDDICGPFRSERLVIFRVQKNWIEGQVSGAEMLS